MAGVIGPVIPPGSPIGTHLNPPTVHVGSPGVIVADPIEPGDLVEPALNPPQLHLVVQFLRVGVFLLFCNDNPRVTTFSRDWAARAMDVTGRYFSTQSGRRQSVVSTVTDWIQLPITTQDWMSVSAAGIDSVRPLIEQQTGVAIENIDHVLIGIDVPGAGGGTTPGAYTYLAAQNFTPQLIAHELGHRFGADDAFRDAPSGPIRYENQFCAMGAGWPATFGHPELADPNAVGLDATGPNMSAPTLLATTWLDPEQPNVALDLTGTDVFTEGRVETLSVLAGAPPPGWSGSPVMIRYHDLVFEYRVRTLDGWDRGLPATGPDAVGHVVAHRSPIGAPVAIFVRSMPAAPGAVMSLGPDPLGQLTVSVVSADPLGSHVRLAFKRRPALLFPELDPLIPGVGELVKVPTEVDTVVWTREGGCFPMPPRSPLERVVQAVAEVQSLNELTLMAVSDEADAIESRAEEALKALAQRVQEVPARTPQSPLAKALDRLAALDALQESLAMHSQDAADVELRNQGRSELQALRQIVLDGIREETSREV